MYRLFLLWLTLWLIIVNFKLINTFRIYFIILIYLLIIILISIMFKWIQLYL